MQKHVGTADGKGKLIPSSGRTCSVLVPGCAVVLDAAPTREQRLLCSWALQALDSPSQSAPSSVSVPADEGPKIYCPSPPKCLDRSRFILQGDAAAPCSATCFKSYFLLKKGGAGRKEQCCSPLACPALRALSCDRSHLPGRAALCCSSFRCIFPVSSPV